MTSGRRESSSPMWCLPERAWSDILKDDAVRPLPVLSYRIHELTIPGQVH